MRSTLKLALAVAVMLIAQQMVLGSSIITMPTADVAPPGVVNVAAYAVNFDGSTPMGDTTMNVYIAYASLVKNLELEANVYDYNNSGFKQQFYVLTYKACEETALLPQISVGVKNPTGEMVNNEDIMNDDASWFVTAVKVLSGPKPGGPFRPVVRLHAGVGTNLHEGLFGGVQTLLTPQIGIAALYDGSFTLLAATFKPSPTLPTFKAGTLGDHTWVGIDYDLRF